MTQQQIDDLKQSLINLINSNLADQSTITATEHRALENSIVDAIFTDKSLKGDIKEIACTQQYITDNFVPSSNIQEEGKALPNSERFGWAICNGKNGTVDKRGNVSVGYDLANGYPLASLGTGGANPPYKQGGSKDAVVVSHTHTFEAYRSYSSTLGLRFGNNDAVETGNTTGTTSDASSGTSGVGKNMQPYIVTLFIQKIS